MSITKICFLASDRAEAQAAKVTLSEKYGCVLPQEAQVIVALGGDGFMLQVMHDHLDLDTPIYGLNFGSVGFLMNEYRENDLLNRLKQAESTTIHPLKMKATNKQGQQSEALALNEVSLLRETRQTAKLRISVDKKVRMEELICDGVIIATPAGSTAYNLSAYGPIIPIDAQLMAITPISAFRPRRWRGALLPHSADLRIDVLENQYRPVSAVADNYEFRDVVDVCVSQDNTVSVTMLFDEGHSLEERLLAEQFS